MNKRVKNSRGLSHGGWGRAGDPQCCEIYFQEFDQTPNVNSKEKFPPSSRGREKGTTLKYARELCS